MSTNTKEVYEGLASACKELLYSGHIADRSLGICHNLRVISQANYHRACGFMDNIVGEWPKFSGSYAYPIPPDGSGQVTAPSAFNYCDDLWAGEQGVLRRELLQFIIDTCKDRIRDLSFPQRDIGPFRALLVE